MESAGISPSPNQIKLEHEADIEIKLEHTNNDDADADEADYKNADYETRLRVHVAELRVQEAEQEARDAELRVRVAEQRALEAEKRALEAEKRAVHERKLRGNYYNQQCRLKKEWDSKKVQFRIEISCLKAQICELQNEEQKTIRNHQEEIGKKNEQIESSEKDLNLFEAMVAARDKTIKQNESDYRTLLDDLISAKITIEDLKSAIWNVCAFLYIMIIKLVPQTNISINIPTIEFNFFVFVSIQFKINASCLYVNKI